MLLFFFRTVPFLRRQFAAEIVGLISALTGFICKSSTAELIRASGCGRGRGREREREREGERGGGRERAGERKTERIEMGGGSISLSPPQLLQIPISFMCHGQLMNL